VYCPGTVTASGMDTASPPVNGASGYLWLDLPVLNDSGQPAHHQGVTAIPGLYFLGLPWQSQRGSALLDGVGHDAAHLAAIITARAQQPKAAAFRGR
jgi:putative flavoprotein involved in K+ transport